ncbi:MAG: hypothetical protein OXE41_08650 [Gammaproteobacteria bacterium]|nr:hypothetical protein [Gammaproteobacteria bacterium]MCY4219539.1 hypothetical protein [Gammaproteobacteria bacterium]MCY4275444.1 hypothetical protein [Gammaproteobacteria bacterium]
MAKLIVSLVYLVPLVILASSWAQGRMTSAVRIGALIILPICYLIHWNLLERMSGWPTDVRIPEQFELVSANVVEPDRVLKQNGSIYLWIRTRLGEPPRSYELEYSRELHTKIVEAQRRLDEGIRQYGETSSGRESGDDGSLGDGGIRLELQDLTERQLPAKTF